MKWGQLGDIVFEFMTSPVYGSLSYSQHAKYISHPRILSRDESGKLQGQKPIKEPDGMELATVSFECKISAFVLKTLSLSVVGAAVAAATPIPGSAVGDLEDDLRFWGDIRGFIGVLKNAQLLQTASPLLVGEDFMGEFTINGLDINEKHKADGTISVAEIKITLEESV
jgi:hypothetical protein